MKAIQCYMYAFVKLGFATNLDINKWYQDSYFLVEQNQGDCSLDTKKTILGYQSLDLKCIKATIVFYYKNTKFKA